MLNRIIAMGRLTRDPELRYTQSGTPVCSFSIACDRDFKSADGNRETDFLDCEAWRGTAEFVSKYFTKGRMAVVDGRMQIKEWTDKNGGKRRSAVINADNVYFGDSKGKDDGKAGAPAPDGSRFNPPPANSHGNPPAGGGRYDPPEDFDPFGDDLP